MPYSLGEEGCDRSISPTSTCGADWRRPDSYWHCVKAAGHKGRHRLRRVR